MTVVDVVLVAASRLAAHRCWKCRHHCFIGGTACNVVFILTDGHLVCGAGSEGCGARERGVWGRGSRDVGAGSEGCGGGERGVWGGR